MKKLAITLSIFPGSLFLIALGSLIICAIAESGLPGGSANIGLGILALTLLINIPTIIVWMIYFAKLNSQRTLADSDEKLVQETPAAKAIE